MFFDNKNNSNRVLIFLLFSTIEILGEKFLVSVKKKTQIHVTMNDYKGLLFISLHNL